ncbi:MAG: hypothetical protein HY300_10110 [Verrucomicrobia bacterium]|nr:hypothetical protein [Verrucomicrobiota bacterium]
MDFITATLGRKVGDPACLVKLLADEETRDQILDDERLLHALLEHHGCLRVSTHFYFYVLVRQVFLRSGIDDRAVTDYVAELLAEFSRIERTRCQLPGQKETLDYFFEMLAALQQADDRTAFMLRVHIGNSSLFLSGVFPDRIRVRAQARGFPDLSYYEGMGRANFRAASDHRLARHYELEKVLGTLAERFQTTRRALNDLSERLLSFGEPDPPASLLLTQ